MIAEPVPQEDKLKKITISEIAKMANVSKSTVSRAINGSSRVSDETRKKVMSLMRAYDFVPDTRARTLSSRKTNTIALVLPGVSGPYYGEIINGVEEILMKNNYFILFMGCEDDESRKRYLNAIEGKRVDGAIILDWQLSPTRLKRVDMPLVLIDSDLTSESISSISIDNASGSYDMANHLIKTHGYTDICFVTGPAESYDSNQRLSGFMRAVKESDLKIGENRIINGDFTFESGRKVAEKILDNLPQVIFASNDEMALGVMEGLKENGVIPGKDVFIVGFDDALWTKFIDPPLTTVRQPIKEIGRISAMRILDSLESGKNTDGINVKHDVNVKHGINVKLGTQLIIRQSCGCQTKKGEI